MEGICESCGREGEDLIRVRRVYVTPPSGDEPAVAQVVGEERWCAVCRAHYPHQPVDGDQGVGSARPE